VIVATEQRVALTRVTFAPRCRRQGASPPAGAPWVTAERPQRPRPSLILAPPLHFSAAPVPQQLVRGLGLL